MVQYTFRRVLLAIPVVFAIMTVTFILARSIPGDPCKAILGEKASALTPVPGGVGPMTINTLIQQSVESGEKSLL